jgi:hypothetical protein
VLLTLVVPQEQPSREEELSLLTSPEALWNVIIVSGSWRMAMSSSRETVEYQTPLTQFIRGICGAVVSQKTNMIPILHELKNHLRASENNSLFDDRLFSKSRMYHWIIKTCHDLCASIQTNLKFLRNFETDQLPALQAKAHQYEQCGLLYWTLRLREEITELDTFQTEVHAFREQVRELVSFNSIILNDDEPQ